jgi:hypothetical protein
MVRIGLAGILLIGTISCGADVEDPGFTAADMSEGSAGETAASASTTASTTASTSTSMGPETTGTGGQDSTGDSTTSGAEDSSSTGSDTAVATTSGGGTCGDGMISRGEQCDGADLQGLDCADLGMGTGALSCDPMTCSFDTSMCMSTTSGTSG